MRTAARATLLLALSIHLCAQSQPKAAVKLILLRDSHLPDQIRKDILAAVVSDIDDGELDVAQAQKVALNSTIGFLKLRPTGPPAIEVIAEDSPECGANAIGNCPVYLFTQAKGHAVLLFQQNGQGIGIERTTHHGLHDIKVVERLNHQTLLATQVYQFDGTTYQTAYCFESNDDDAGHPVETPRHKC